MTMVANMFREFSMEAVRGYNQLTYSQKNLFDSTYKEHLSSISLDERRRYSEYNIVRISQVSNYIKVQFACGEAFLYLQNGRWMESPKNLR